MPSRESQAEKETPAWKDSPTITGVLFIVVMLSPFGAPLLAKATRVACDIPWEGPYDCVVPSSLISYFNMTFWAPLFLIGPLALLWFTLCLSAVVISLGWFVLACWAAIAKRI